MAHYTNDLINLIELNPLVLLASSVTGAVAHLLSRSSKPEVTNTLLDDWN
jgi:hypothetical protein